MRWIFIILLMCNGIYFLWQSHLQPESPSRAVPVAIKPINAGRQLVLLYELESDPGRLLAARPVAVAANSRPPGGDRPTVASQRPVREPTADPAALVAPTSSTELAKAKPAETKPAKTGPAKTNTCWLLGPIKEEISRKQLLNRMAALDIELQLQQVEMEGRPSYWVHLPPQVTRKAAVKLLRELQNKNIDSFLITEGELANGISLGLFTQKPLAEKIRDQRQRQGYKPQIKFEPRTRVETWALFDGRKYGPLTEPLWERVQQGNAGIERHKNYCDKIASTSNFE